jgi:uncharacterized membrane protein YfcA
MEPGKAALLVATAIIGGALNSVAGGGSFFTFPALIFAGVPAIPANATSSVALWPGSLASAFAYRRDLQGSRRMFLWLGGASLVGGAIGALLLVWTPSSVFDVLVPFLLLLATVLFALGPRITARFRASADQREFSIPGATAGQFLISIYGGYFGGGMGMMMLATYSLLGMEDIHRMNGLKTFTAVLINAAAIVIFVVTGVVRWPFGLIMVAGAVAGGYGGASLARKLKPNWVRIFVICVGLALSAVFFARAFGHT